DDEKLKLRASYFLILDSDDLADAMRGIDNELGRLEAVALGSLFMGHCRAARFFWLVTQHGFCGRPRGGLGRYFRRLLNGFLRRRFGGSRAGMAGGRGWRWPSPC